MSKQEFDIYAPMDMKIYYIGPESELRNGEEYKSKYGLRIYAEIQSNLFPEMFLLLAHLESVVVKNGQYVRQGEKVGTMGNSGTASRHLHVGLYPSIDKLRATYAVDPGELLRLGYPVCNTRQSVGGHWHADYSRIHGRPYLHKGIDFSGLQSNLIDGWEHDCDHFKEEFRSWVV